MKIDEIFNPSDVVYIPKETYHQVIPLTKRLSVSFPMADYLSDYSSQDRNWIKI